MLKKYVGRPLKVGYKIMSKLEDALRNGSNVTEACNYAGISRDTYYRYLLTSEMFAYRMQTARNDRSILASIFF
jgi:ACT domain-containing protein